MGIVVFIVQNHHRRLPVQHRGVMSRLSASPEAIWSVNVQKVAKNMLI